VPPVFRFAPSPNGRLHLGHALSALLNADLAAELGGRLLLRIEDIDTERCTPELEAGMLDDLRRLGLVWEEPVRRQSQHLDTYGAALQRLVATGLAYPAFMSRADVRDYIAQFERNGASWPRDPDGAPHYPPVDRNLAPRAARRRIAAGEVPTWRLDMGKAMSQAGSGLAWTEVSGVRLRGAETVPADPSAWGDVVLARRDVPTSYHLSVVVDDALQGVTHVVRGRDLFHATSVHRLLQRLLGLPAPAYHHHRLIVGADGRKLSKSEGSAALSVLFGEGLDQAEIRRLVGLD
jgi:glutamyl-Q tRNA(Asp) synthetase